MAKEITYEQYLDKVYGGWLGKSIAGTIGAPYEGIKQEFDFEYKPEMFQTMIPNDDLDLQVLWLHVMEQEGIHITSRDLAEAFVKYCPYAPGEYAYSKRNILRGIYPPYSGTFNNKYFSEGMGCLIRSELWAFICPGNPDLAATYAGKDGVIDHARPSVEMEMFFAALEAEAFVEKDIRALVLSNLRFLSEDSKPRRLVQDVVAWCAECSDWKIIRQKILLAYGHPDCTNMYENAGFILMALLLGNGDFAKTTMIALNCGYDTDCTCATSGAVLGIIWGAKELQERWNIKDANTRYTLGVTIERRSDRLIDLAEDTCVIGLEIAESLNPAVDITNIPDDLHIRCSERTLPKIVLDVEYPGVPSIAPGETCEAIVVVRNTTDALLESELVICSDEGIQHSVSGIKLLLRPFEINRVEISYYLPIDTKMVKNSYKTQIRAFVGQVEETKLQFGLAGAGIWKAFGPFWDNYDFDPEANDDESVFRTSYVHFTLSSTVDPDKEYLSEGLLASQEWSDDEVGSFTLHSHEDKLDLDNAVGMDGPCCVYLRGKIVSPVEQKIWLNIGNNDAFKIWLNGDLVWEKDEINWWTGLNNLVLTELAEGDNLVVIKVVRRSRSFEFSLAFRKVEPEFGIYGDFCDNLSYLNK